MTFKIAQGSIEFMITFGAVMFFFILFFYSIQQQTSRESSEKERVILQSIALGVKEEINLAYESSEGYQREFQIPTKVLGRDYEISISEGHVYVHTEKNGVAYKVLEIEGAINKGENVIKKKNGAIYLNN